MEIMAVDGKKSGLLTARAVKMWLKKNNRISVLTMKNGQKWLCDVSAMNSKVFKGRK